MTMMEMIYFLFIGGLITASGILLFTKELEFKRLSKQVVGKIVKFEHSGEDIYAVIHFYDDYHKQDVTFKSFVSPVLKKVGNDVLVRYYINSKNNRYEASIRLHLMSIFHLLVGIVFLSVPFLNWVVDFVQINRSVFGLYLYLFTIPFIVMIITLFIQEQKRWIKK